MRLRVCLLCTRDACALRVHSRLARGEARQFCAADADGTGRVEYAEYARILADVSCIEHYCTHGQWVSVTICLRSSLCDDAS